MAEVLKGRELRIEPKALQLLTKWNLGVNWYLVGVAGLWRVGPSKENRGRKEMTNFHNDPHSESPSFRFLLEPLRKAQAFSFRL